MTESSSIPTWSSPEPGATSSPGSAPAETADDAGGSVDADPTGAVLLEQTIRVTAGLVALGVASLADAIRHTIPAPPPTDEPAPERLDPLGVTTGAVLGFTLLVGDRLASAVGGLSRVVGPPSSWIAGVPPLGPAAGWVRAAATSLDERWRTSRPEAEAVASSFARELVPQVVDAVLDQLDLTWLVAERVDLDELIARADLDAAVERVDIERILARVDLNQVASRLDVDSVVARVDLDAIVSRIDLDSVVSRVDLDAVARRLDVDAVVDRIDLVGLARYVVDEIDLPEIIRESTGSMASETVRGVRIQGIEADAAVARAVDRVLLRRRARATEAPGEPGSALTDPGADDPGPDA